MREMNFLAKYWNQAIETLERSKLEEIQLQRLQATATRVYNNVPHYKRAFNKKNIQPTDIKSLNDLAKLPFTYKTDLRDNYPYSLFAAPMNEIVRIHSSSGTTGKPIVVAYTKNDLKMWSELIARCLVATGVTEDDIVQNAYGYGLFTGGLGLHHGTEELGATVIPISGGNSNRQVMLMEDYGSTVLACTPSYALNLAEVLKDSEIGLERLKLRIGIFGAEPWSNEMRLEIERALGIEAYDIYGLSEILGPGVGIECSEKNGLHLWEDHFIAEIIDPETEEVLPLGSVGELVITCISKEAFPMIRYRTRDITSLKYEKCACGRTHARMERFTGRSDDMLIIRGVNVFPSQIESAILASGDIAEPHYLIVVDRKGTMDYLEVWVEVAEKYFSDEVKMLEVLAANIKHSIESTLGISIKLRLVEPKTIERSEGKAKRVIDKRQK